jgi:hypothetical protein
MKKHIKLLTLAMPEHGHGCFSPVYQVYNEYVLVLSEKQSDE